MSADFEPRPEPQTDAEFQALDNEYADEDLRRAAASARTEDEYLEALRSAGSLGAGMEAIAAPRVLNKAALSNIRDALRRREAEDTRAQRHSADFYANTPEGRAAAARVEATHDAAEAAYRAGLKESA